MSVHAIDDDRAAGGQPLTPFGIRFRVPANRADDHLVGGIETGGPAHIDDEWRAFRAAGGIKIPRGNRE
jgi:hypothetical protein